MKLVKPSELERDVPRGVVGGAEISQATTGAHNIYMGIFRVPAGARGRPHYHDNCESALYMLSGAIEIRWGDQLQDSLTVEAGDMLYVPPRETHTVRTSPTPSRPSTSSRATRRPRTRSRCRGRTSSSIASGPQRGRVRPFRYSLLTLWRAKRGPKGSDPVACWRVRTLDE